MSKNLPCGYEKRKKRKEEQHKLSKLFEISSSCSNTPFLLKIKVTLKLIVFILKLILNQV